MTQQFSDPRSIGFEGPPSQVSKAYPSDQVHPFLPAFLFLIIFFMPSLVHQAPCSTSSPTLTSCLLCTSATFGFSFLPSIAFAWPKALIAKLVYIGEINALQMRLNTYSEKCRQCVSGLSPKSGRKESVFGTKLGSRSEACRYSPSHPLLRRKRGGFSILHATL